ncbi:hypothetical protein Bca52824_024690 [Brassica carinata]|uniref:Uncharacterized protein n=1 Tax=Brassica carinata TaxID=52824 RepID=A0A8X8AW25_BRACI|nr:hypothetical protein Bca52824_024690 [Brassica carinata]
MALNRVCSEEFSFPLLASRVSGIGSPPLWKHSPETFRHQSKSFSYVERRSLWTDEKMDMLWEDLNEELPPRSKSLRIDISGEKKESLLIDESSAVAVGCGKKLTKKTPLKKKKKKSPNVLVLMRVLKKLLALRSSSQRSPAKTHPR